MLLCAVVLNFRLVLFVVIGAPIKTICYYSIKLYSNPKFKRSRQTRLVGKRRNWVGLLGIVESCTVFKLKTITSTGWHRGLIYMSKLGNQKEISPESDVSRNGNATICSTCYSTGVTFHAESTLIASDAYRFQLRLWCTIKTYQMQFTPLHNRHLYY